MASLLRIAFAGIVTLGLTAASASATEYLLTGQKPDKLLLVDAKARKIVKTIIVPNAGPGLLTITPAPDGSRAYTITNRWESVSGLDLDTGKEVFRANFSSGDIRAKAMFGMDISPDGKRLYVQISPVELGLGEYHVKDNYIAVYNTADGLDAKPVQMFPAPRRAPVLVVSTDGTKLYSVNWDITVLDANTGKQLGVHKIRHWGRANYSEPDILDVWPQWDQSGIFSTPYYAVRTDKAADDPAAYPVGMLTLDLATDEFKMEDYENFAAIIFSTVVNPVRRNEVYGVYTTLSKIDIDQDKLLKRINLPHTYYAINVSRDGSELYVAGTMDDIGVYNTETLENIGTIKLPGGGDMTLASLRMIER